MATLSGKPSYTTLRDTTGVLLHANLHLARFADGVVGDWVGSIPCAAGEEVYFLLSHPAIDASS